MAVKLTAIEFFAGSGLVRLGLSPDFESVWANDISPQKRATYVANFGEKTFCPGSIEDVKGEALPPADLAWASFPCQDLSLAGNLQGMSKGTRSGMFWEWIRVLWELRECGSLPPVLVAENVVGFVVAKDGSHFREAHEALRELGYRVGALIIDASHFLPQSRPRAFVIAVRDGVALDGLEAKYPSLPYHPSGLVRTARMIRDPKWVWWSLPTPGGKRLDFTDICERHAPYQPEAATKDLLRMLSPINKKKLQMARKSGAFLAGTAYKRTRPDTNGISIQRLEIRFDGTAGCLRTPNGGSSRQTVILVEDGEVRSRLLTVRECARLMGAPDTFKLPGSYNDGYRAMGDAVAVPVTRWLSKHILKPLVARVKNIELQETEFRPLSLLNAIPNEKSIAQVGGR